MMNHAEIIGLNKMSPPMQIKDGKIGSILNTWCLDRTEKLPVILRLKADSCSSSALISAFKILLQM